MSKCCLRIALGIIAACGLAVSMGAITSYLPLNAGYWGGVACILSLTAFVIFCLCSSKKYSISETDPLVFDRSGTLGRHENTNIWNDRQLKDATLTVQKVDELPDEIYANIFKELNGKDLANTSKVCRRWNRLASDNLLWESLCLQESMSPEGQALSTYNYQELYRRSTILNKQIRKMAPKMLSTQFDVSKYQRQDINVDVFFKIKGYVFLLSTHFEMWDASLRICHFSKTISKAFFFESKIKWINNSIYLIGRQSHSMQKVDPPRRIFLVYEYNLKDGDLVFKSKWTFVAQNIWHRPGTLFELEKDHAFIGRYEGVIDAVNLAKEGIRFVDVDEQNIEYSDVSDWYPEEEHTWQASFSKKTEIQAGNVLENGEWKPIWMEEGAYERRLMHKRRDNHLAIQERKQLIGHEGAITAMSACGNYLFSSSEDGTIKQWDLSNYTCTCTIDTGFKTGCCILQIAGSYIFGLEKSKRETISQWDIVSNQCIYSFDLKKECHSFYVTGNVLFCLCQQEKNTIEIFDLSTKEQIKTLVCPSGTWHPQFLYENNCLHYLNSEQIVTWNFSSPQ